MPQAQVLSILDTKPVPDVARSFNPFERENGRTEWRADFESVPIANPRIAVKQWTKSPGSARARDMSTLTVSVAKMATLGTNDGGIEPPPTVQWLNSIRVEMDVHESTAVIDREQLIFFLIYALQNADINLAMKTGERFY